MIVCNSYYYQNNKCFIVYSSYLISKLNNELIDLKRNKTKEIREIYSANL